MLLLFWDPVINFFQAFLQKEIQHLLFVWVIRVFFLFFYNVTVLLVTSKVNLKHRHCSWNAQFQKRSILPQRKDWNFLGGGGSLRANNLKCILSSIGISRGGGEGSLGENFFHGEGMDIFWNYTMSLTVLQILSTSHNQLCTTAVIPSTAHHPHPGEKPDCLPLHV